MNPHHVKKVIQREIGNVPSVTVARVVDQNLTVAGMPGELRDDPLVGQVAHDNHDLHAKLTDFRRVLVQERGPPSADNEVVARAGNLTCELQPDSARCPRDNCCFAHVTFFTIGCLWSEKQMLFICS